jgi:hypothetical protein
MALCAPARSALGEEKRSISKPGADGFFLKGTGVACDEHEIVG